MLLTGYDGRNCAVSVSAVEMKCLFYVLQNDVETAAKLMTAEGFYYTPEDVKATVNAAWLIMRNLLDDVNNLPEDTGDKMVQ